MLQVAQNRPLALTHYCLTTSHAYIIRLLNDLRIELTLAATHEFQSTIEKTQ